MQLVTTPEALTELLPTLAGARRLAFDLEANGRFAYRARVCMVQLGWEGGTAIVDALATSLVPLGPVLGEGGPVKIVHDVAFDARMLGELGIHLGNVHDTALAAQLLGRPATGLASLALSELGVTLDKTLQSHDWARRPLDPAMLAYLETDVTHLAALEDKLWALVLGTPAEGGSPAIPGIETELYEETRYRIASAIEGATAPDPRPVYARIKGIEKLGPAALAVARRLAQARDREAQRLDVPPNELVGNGPLLDLAKAMPADLESLKRVRGAMPRHQGYAVAKELLKAIAAGIADRVVPEEDLPWLERPRVPAEIARTRRARENKLLQWRKAAALARHVNEQVVLPGHCLKDVAELDVIDREHLGRVAGIGAFRVERDGQDILAALALADEPKAGPAAAETV